MKQIDKLAIISMILLCGANISFAYALKVVSLGDIIERPLFAFLSIVSTLLVGKWILSIAHERVLRGQLFKTEAQT